MSSTLWIAQMMAPRTDRAFDRTHADWKTLAAKYCRTRSEKDLAALPLKEGQKPRLWGLKQLEPTSYALVTGLANVAQRAQFTFKVGCLERRDPSGLTVRASLADRAGVADAPAVAEESWLKEARKVGGEILIEEIAAVILRWTELGDLDDALLEEYAADPFALFALPPGGALPR